MRIEYGWYPKYNIWAVYLIDKGKTVEFEYAGNIETVRIIIRNYCSRFKVCSIVKLRGKES